MWRSCLQLPYIVDYTDRAGDWHIKTFTLKRKAEAELARITNEVAAGTHTPSNRSTTIAAAGAAWIEQAETDELERATVRQYKQHLAHITPLLGNRKLSDLTVADVTPFRNDLRKVGHSPVMAKRSSAVSAPSSSTRNPGALLCRTSSAPRCRRTGPQAAAVAWSRSAKSVRSRLASISRQRMRLAP